MLLTCMENPNIDMIVQNEGEIAFKELLLAMKNKSPLSNVPNLWYKENGEVRCCNVRWHHFSR